MPISFTKNVFKLTSALIARRTLTIPRPHQAFSRLLTDKRKPLHMDFVLLEPSPHDLKILPHNQYVAGDHISPATVDPSPLNQFRAWYKDAAEGGKVKEAEAMTLSTATPSGIPSARIVLLKQVDTRGFVFFSNYTSRKAQELTANPHAALVFYWREIHKSVRVVGRVEKLSREESSEYFQSRPVGSRLGAWASKQSTVIEEGALAERLKKVTERFGVQNEQGDVPTPEFWGGWRVVPDEVEFWCGNPSRLHDRVRYLLVEGSSDENPTWKIERLSP